MQHTFSTPAPVQAYVELGAGSVVVRAEQTDQTDVRITGPRAEEFLVEHRGDAVTVVAPKGRRFLGDDAHDIELVVPTGSDLATKTGSATTTTHGELRELRLKTGSGDVDVELATGPALVESGSGDVHAAVLSDEASIKSGSGDVMLDEVGGQVAVSTGSGDVALGSARARTLVKTGSGDLYVRESDAQVSLSTASGTLRVGRANAGLVSGKSASGDVRVGIPAGLPVWADINTVSGRVVRDIESAGSPEDGAPYLELRVTSVSGDVHLVPAEPA